MARTMYANDLSLLILQLGVGLTFAAHGAQKLLGWWGGPGLTGWEAGMIRMGFRPARLFAVVSAVIEFGGGLLLAVGLLAPLAAAVLVAQSVVIIGHVHLPNGFFNSKSGFEYPMILGIGAAAVGLGGLGAISVDAVLGLAFGPEVRIALVALGILAGLAALAVPRLRVNTQVAA